MPVDIPKIHTDSKGDILFLQSQFKESAVPSLTSKSTDAKTQSALDMVCGWAVLCCSATDFFVQWIESLFEDASANIQVNGLEFKKAFEAVEGLCLMALMLVMDDSNANPEFEPFDTAVFERAQALGFQKSDLLVKIIELRKAVPAKIGQIVGEMTRMERARLANDTLEKFNIATDTWKGASFNFQWTLWDPRVEFYSSRCALR